MFVSDLFPGLTLLIPHLISKKPPWDGCKLKIFYLQGKPHLLDEAQRKMIALLSKFRIDFSDAVAVNTTKPPKEDRYLSRSIFSWCAVLSQFSMNITKTKFDLI